MHQAILAGVILNQYNQTDLLELSDNYNYPAHLWDQDKTDLRPSSFDEIITLRHEGFYKDSDWRKNMPISTDKINWLSMHLVGFGSADI